MRSIIFHAGALSGAALSLAFAGSAQAQATPPNEAIPVPTSASPGQTASAEPGNPGTPDIIVTAQKRAERLQDVPISITAISADALVQSGAKNLTELQGVVPGVYFSSNVGYATSPITIRGTAGASAALLDDPVAVYVNGVYQSSSGASQGSLIDIGSIEVARGPQGTLQGRNATAGAVLINTAMPTSTLGGFIRASYADPTEARAEGAIGAPLTDTLGVRVAGGYTYERGWAHNTFNNTYLGGGRSASGRVTLRWRPTSDLDIRLIGAHTYNRTDPAQVRYAQTAFNPSPIGALVLPGTATPTTPLTSDQLHAIIDDNQYSLNRANEFRVIDDSVVLNADWQIGGVDLVSVTGYNKTSNVGAGDSDALGRTDRDGFNTASLPSRVFSQEVRLQSSGARMFTWILGGYYSSAIQRLNFVINNLQLSVPIRVSTNFVSDQDTRSRAGFADGTLHLTPKIAVIGGIRYTRETKTFTLDRAASNYDTGAAVAPLFTYRPGQAVFTNTSFRAKATYQPTRDILLYASYSTGFKSGGFNAFGSDPAFNPETLKSAELGVKADLLDRRASVALAAYTNRYDGLQIRAGVPAGGVAITNAANSRIDGFEFEASLRPTRDFTLSGNLAYTNARFISFPAARNLLDQGPIDASGNQLPRSPKWQGFVEANYSPALTADITGVFEASYRYTGRVFYYQTDQNSPTVTGNPLSEVGLRAGINLVPQQLSIVAFATNLNNGRSVSSLLVNFSYPVAGFNKPRSVGIQIEKKF